MMADSQSFGWRASLYFIAAFAGSWYVQVLRFGGSVLIRSWVMFIFFPDTWRREVGPIYRRYHRKSADKIAIKSLSNRH
jgi:hypothetical protein